jgi:integrase
VADDLWHQQKGEKVACGCGGLRVPSAKHGRGKRWRARVTDASGKLLQPSFERKVDAEAFEASVRTDVARGTYVDPDAGKLKLREYGETWLATVWSSGGDSSREHMERRFRLYVYPVLGDYELRVLAQRPSIIQGWLAGLRTTMADNSVRPIFHHLAQMLSVATEDGLITRNPCRVKSVSTTVPARVRKKVRPWTAEQVKALRDGLPALYAATVDAGSGLGLRQGEAFGLAVEDITPWLSRTRVLHVQRQVKLLRGVLVFDLPKGGKEREVPVPEVTALRLSAHLERFPARAITLPWGAPDGKPTTVRLIFTNRRGFAIAKNNFNHTWKRGLQRAGIEPTREHGFHMLRHTYASTLLADGVDIRVVAEYLGHTDPGFTLREYTHLTEKAPDRARKAIDEAYETEREEEAG